jgi:hypothetical protein
MCHCGDIQCSLLVRQYFKLLIISISEFRHVICSHVHLMTLHRRFRLLRKSAVIPHYETINFEKRGHARLPFQLPTEYSRTSSFRPRFGHTVNISERGILVRLPEKINLGENLLVKVYFDMDFGLHFIKTLAEVVWLDDTEETKKGFRCGLEFLEMSNENQKKLEKFIKSFF